MHRFILIILLFTLAASLAGCNPRVPATLTLTDLPTPCVGKTITLGEISDDPGQVIRDTQRISNYIAKHLTAFGFVCGRVRVFNNVQETIRAMNIGEVDIYWDSLYPAALVSRETGARPILRRWRNCDPEYFSVIFTKADSGIQTLGDLPGHMIAMDRPDSTSGFALPAVYLLDHNLTLVVKEAYDAPVAMGEVGVTFTYDDQNTLALVLAGKVSAGATDDFFFDKWASQPEKRLIMLGKTDSTLRQAVLLRKDLDSSLQSAIKQVLLEASSNPEGVEALKEAASTCKFDDEPEQIEASFNQMNTLDARLQAVPGWMEAMDK